MLRNYLYIAFRNLLKHKGHALINITGLSVGIAVFLLLFLWIHDELSYDRFHKNANNIFRIISEGLSQGNVQPFAITPAPLAPALKEEFPWIKKTVRLTSNKALVTFKNRSFREKIFFADPSFLEVFDFPIVQGNSWKALTEPRSLLISERIKVKYFGNEDPIGQTVNIYEKDFTIQGVFKDIPQNSHISMDFLGSLLHYRRDYHSQWGAWNFWTYILTTDNPPIASFREKMPDFITKYQGEDTYKVNKVRYDLQPLKDIHLFSHLRNEIKPNGDFLSVLLFSTIVLIILVIACLNYINLSTARFAGRTREVGIRKVLGAMPNQLTIQFLGESVLVAAISFPFALIMARACLPVFNLLAGKSLSFLYFKQIEWLLLVLLFIPIIGLIAGLVPAVFISIFRPVEALKRAIRSGNFFPGMRKILVVFQFTLSIIFIIVALTIYNQLQFTQNKDLGLNPTNLINIYLNQNKEALQKLDAIQQEFQQLPGVISVCASGFVPGGTFWNNNYWHDGVGSEQYLMIGCIPIDHNFFKTMQIDFVEGRPFSRDFPTDKNNFILNEAALKEFGWKSAVGKHFDINHWKIGQVIGVVKNFHFDSLRERVKPLVLYFEPEHLEYIQVRFASPEVQQVIANLKQKWMKLVPSQEFNFTFMEDDYKNLYKSEWKLGEIFGIVTVLAFFIACLGLFGLAAYESERRTKEIGIRKVVGASIPDILYLLSKNFISWVLLANLFAWPFAWYAISKWLQNFAYPVGISAFTFVYAGLIAMFTALLTVSYKVFKTARANPVQSLRYE